LSPSRETGVVPYQINLHPAFALRLRGGPAPAPAAPTPADDGTPKTKRFKLVVADHPKARKIAVLALLIGVAGIAREAGSHVYLATAQRTLDPIIDDSVKVAKMSRSLSSYRARRDSVYAMALRVQIMDVHRHVLAHLVDEITNALPSTRWLQKLSPASTTMGAAPDSTALMEDPEILVEVARAMSEDLPLLMQNLEKSPWIRSVTLKEAVESVVGNTPVQKVTLRILAKRDTSTASPLNRRSTAPPIPKTGVSKRLIEETK